MLEYNNVILVGYGGHAKVIADSCLENEYSIKGYIDKVNQNDDLFKLKYLGTEQDYQVQNNDFFFPAVGDNNLRQKLINWVEQISENKLILIDSSARVSKSVSCGSFTFVAKNVSVNASSSIGKGVILNTSSVIEHECIIEDFVHVAPGAVLAGNVSVGKLSFVGANTTVKQGVKIGANCIIGAGAVVLHNIEDNQTWVGNPAKRIK